MARKIALLKPHLNEVGAIRPFEDALIESLLHKGVEVLEIPLTDIRGYANEKRRALLSIRDVPRIALEETFEMFLVCFDISRRLEAAAQFLMEGWHIAELHGYEGESDFVLLFTGIKHWELLEGTVRQVQEIIKGNAKGVELLTSIGVLQERPRANLYERSSELIFGKKLSTLLREVEGLISQVKSTGRVVSVEFPGTRREKSDEEIDNYFENNWVWSKMFGRALTFTFNYLLSEIDPLEGELDVEGVTEELSHYLMEENLFEAA